VPLCVAVPDREAVWVAVEAVAERVADNVTSVLVPLRVSLAERVSVAVISVRVAERVAVAEISVRVAE